MPYISEQVVAAAADRARQPVDAGLPEERVRRLQPDRPVQPEGRLQRVSARERHPAALAGRGRARQRGRLPVLEPGRGGVGDRGAAVRDRVRAHRVRPGGARRVGAVPGRPQAAPAGADTLARSSRAAGDARREVRRPGRSGRPWSRPSSTAAPRRLATGTQSVADDLRDLRLACSAAGGSTGFCGDLDRVQIRSRGLALGSRMTRSRHPRVARATTVVAAGADALADGEQKVARGAQSLDRASGRLSTSATKLSSGASSVAGGATSVDDATGKLVGGTAGHLLGRRRAWPPAARR